MAAPKKHASTRARRNTAAGATTLTLATDAIVPALPSHPGYRDDEGNSVPADWHSETLAWWGDLWTSPMSREYLPSDKHALVMLAVLVDEFWIAPSTKLAAEIRLQRQSFGLTPYDRRRLEWTIEATEDAKERGQRRRTGQTSKQPAENTDPRLVLVQ